MFVDASVLFAIIARENDSADLASRMAEREDAITSPDATWEATISLARVGQDRSFDEAAELAADVLRSFAISTVPMTPEIGALAIDASRRYGRGRLSAALNMGDCFSDACARAHHVPRLSKGDDFSRTDVEAA